MVEGDLTQVHAEIMAANRPEDLFGSQDVVFPEKTLLEFIAEKYDAFKTVTRPDQYQNVSEIELAREADDQLERLYALAKDLSKDHVYGIEGRGTYRPAYASKWFDIGPNRYYIGRQLVDGRYTNHYEAFIERDGYTLGTAFLKLAKGDPNNASLAAINNGFVQREVRNLDILHQEQSDLWMHLPIIFNRFESGSRQGLVLRKISGFTLAQVRQHRANLNGIDQKDMVWMLDRILRALVYVHGRGIVHGNIGPDRVIIQPPTHNVLLCGWSGGVYQPAISGEKVTTAADVFTAPEVRSQGRIGPWSDLYSLGKLMIWLLGGDPATNEIPVAVHERIAKFLLRLAHEDQFERPATALEPYEEQLRIKDVRQGGLWEKRWRHFDMS